MLAPVPVPAPVVPAPVPMPAPVVPAPVPVPDAIASWMSIVMTVPRSAFNGLASEAPSSPAYGRQPRQGRARQGRAQGRACPCGQLRTSVIWVALPPQTSAQPARMSGPARSDLLS
ncbi:hypothetical protein E3O65_05195 [Cryobacterium breve]|uniref:Uncharacterized protein n=1 Tax=Cryobacterium breve TaxID=1259258 RepID=A0ABY2J4B3_9MICO|nr:hypothetical protein E3T20_12310 [Cryobacterium sp. TmT3-12]TFC99771.1 hypothetical protein E3O65_05195 [Cryobacterium breve]